MYKLKYEDTGTILLFLDAFSAVPGVGPASDMDGHDLSSLTYSEEQRLENFIDNFNEYYADKAERTTIMNMPAIIVKDFWEDKILGDPDDSQEDEDYASIDNTSLENMVSAAKTFWHEYFDLTKEEEQEFEKKLREKYKK